MKIIVNFLLSQLGAEIIITSYHLYGKPPPEKIVEELAKQENMEIEEFKKQYLNPEQFFTNQLAKFTSYPVGWIGKAIFRTGKFMDDIVEFLIYYLKYVSIVFGAIFLSFVFLYIIIKWRS